MVVKNYHSTPLSAGDMFWDPAIYKLGTEINHKTNNEKE
jgi:hypothetical protein